MKKIGDNRFGVGIMTIALAFMLSILFLLVLIPSPTSAVTIETWNQTSGNLASTDANWLDGTKPVSSSNTQIVFDATSTAVCTWDLNIAVGAFSMDTGYSGTVTLASDITVNGPTAWTQGTLNGGTAYTWSQNGPIVKYSAFAITASTLNLAFVTSYADHWFTLSAFTLRNLYFNVSANLTMTTVGQIISLTGDFYIANGATVTVNKSGAGLDFVIASTNTWTNLGIIAGPGGVQIASSTVNITGFVFGTCTATGTAPYFYHLDAVSDSRSIQLGAALVTSGSIKIEGGTSAVKTLTIDTSPNNWQITANGITILAKGILNARGSTVTDVGNWDSSAGIFTEGTSLIRMNGVSKTIKTVGGQQFYNLQISTGKSASLASAVVIGNGLFVDGTFTHGSNYQITVTGMTTNTGTITQGTGAWAFTGGFTQTAGTFNQGRLITSGSVLISGGNVYCDPAYTWTCSANFTHTGGNIQEYLLNLVMSSDAAVITNTNVIWSIRHLELNNCTIIANKFLAVDGGTFILNTGKVLTLMGPDVFYYYPMDIVNTSFNNLGTFTGPGHWGMVFAGFTTYSPTFIFGVINCPVDIYGYVTTPANQKIYLGADTTFGSDLLIWCADPNEKLTFSHGNNYTLTVLGTVTLGDRSVMTQGTGTWTFGNYFQNGTAQYFYGSWIPTQFNGGAGELSVIGSMRMTNGQFVTNRTTSFTIDDQILTISPSIAQYMTISNLTSDAESVSWVINAATGNITFSVSGLEIGARCYVDIDGTRAHALRASESGAISFIYSGPWSAHDFEVVKSVYPPTIAHLGLVLGIMMALVIAVPVIVTVAQIANEKRKFRSEDIINMAIFIMIGVILLGAVYALLP